MSFILILCQAFNGLSAQNLEIVNECVYTPGVSLGYNQTRKMVHSVSGPSKNTWSMFVHKLNNANIEGAYLVVPKKIIDLLQHNRVHLARTGVLLLVDDLQTQVEALYKTTQDGRMVIQGGFGEYAHKIGFEVDPIVVVAFQKRRVHHQVNVCFTIIGQLTTDEPQV